MTCSVFPVGHHDSLQIRRGDNVTIRGNNFQAYKASTDDPMNAAIQMGSLLGTNPISNFLVEGNLMNGGNFTINGGNGIVDSALYRNDGSVGTIATVQSATSTRIPSGMPQTPTKTTTNPSAKPTAAGLIGRQPDCR